MRMSFGGSSAAVMRVGAPISSAWAKPGALRSSVGGQEVRQLAWMAERDAVAGLDLVGNDAETIDNHTPGSRGRRNTVGSGRA